MQQRHAGCRTPTPARSRLLRRDAQQRACSPTGNNGSLSGKRLRLGLQRELTPSTAATMATWTQVSGHFAQRRVPGRPDDQQLRAPRREQRRHEQRDLRRQRRRRVLVLLQRRDVDAGHRHLRADWRVLRRAQHLRRHLRVRQQLRHHLPVESQHRSHRLVLQRVWLRAGDVERRALYGRRDVHPYRSTSRRRSAPRLSPSAASANFDDAGCGIWFDPSGQPLLHQR